jgi:uncharacterized NAD(P)/FAD-binding protein YdhS
VRPDHAGLGVDTSADGLAIDSQGSPVPGLLVAGPLAQGRVGELMGLPEVVRHAVFIAGEIHRRLFALDRLAG